MKTVTKATAKPSNEKEAQRATEVDNEKAQTEKAQPRAKPTDTALASDFKPRTRKGDEVQSDELRRLAAELDHAGLSGNPDAIISAVATRLREIAN